MSSQTPKSAKPSKHSNQSSNPPFSRTQSSIPSHLAMVELKQRILTSLSKLSDRDTHHIAVEDLEKIIQTLTPDGLPMLLNCLCDASVDPKPAVKKESLRLLAVLCASHGDPASTHLVKIIGCIVKRLKDSDSSVRDACRDAIGALSSRYLKSEGDNGGVGSVVSLFVKPLFEAMNEQSKGVQAGAAMCMGKMVECASSPPVAAFQKLCPRICKFLNNPNFHAKATLLPVVASLSQVGAISPQNLEVILHCIHDCLGSSDWATRKAAADTLSALALYSSSLIADKASSTLRVLEACRFDKIKPVRDSMAEALQLWKKIAGKTEGAPEDLKTLPHEAGNSDPAELSGKNNPQSLNSDERRRDPSLEDPSNNRSPITCGSVSKAKGGSISDKAVGILKKKAPALTDKELNLEFFQKLETRGSGEVPVEVIVPSRRCLSNEEEAGADDNALGERSNHIGNSQPDVGNDSASVKYRNMERGTANVLSKQRDFAERNGKHLDMSSCDVDDRNDVNHGEPSGVHGGFSKTEGQSDGSFTSSKGNWLAIQRQLLQLERQQTHLMNMLQDFMGGSHDSMMTLENRVRGLERVVEDMARDLSNSSARRGSNFMVGCEGSSCRPLSKYSGFPDYSMAKFGREGDGRIPFGERYALSNNLASSIRGRGPSQAWNFHTNGASRNGQMGSRRGGLGGNPLEDRLSQSELDTDRDGNRRAWDNKGDGPIRLGEGPSARSVWQASKDEATLEAIRVAGEDNGKTRTARLAVPELTAEAVGDDNIVQERDSIWTSWSNAMDALRVGDTDTAYAEVLSTGDDLLLVKLMDRSGPVVDQLSNEIASEVLLAVGQFLLEQNLFDICLSWIQQLVDVVLENGADILRIPTETKRELLSNLHEASSMLDPPEDWEGASPEQILLHLASAWGINLQQLQK